jgi:hypothetical protein
VSGRTSHHAHPDRVLDGREGDLTRELDRGAVDLGVPTVQVALSEGLWGHAWDELLDKLGPEPGWWYGLPCVRDAMTRGVRIHEEPTQ